MNVSLIGAGGTGGHLYPGIATAHALRQRGWAVRFVVNRGDRGIEILQRLGLPFHPIVTPRVVRRLSWRWGRLPWDLGQGVLEARQLLKSNRPHAVLGMGGYVTVPLVLAAWGMGLPTVIHEQNAVPGLANRWLSRVVGRVAVSFPETLPLLPVEKVVVTGCPIRPEIGHVARAEAHRFFGLSAGRVTGLVLGGSLGAHRLNELVLQVLPAMAGLKDHLQWIHLTGAEDADAVKRGYTAATWSHRVFAYLDEMAHAYAASDFVIARAGGSTIAELMAAALPALLVPYPHAANDHQFANAAPLAQIGAATLMREAELTPARLAGWVAPLVRDAAWRHQLTVRIHPLQPRELSAADALARLVEDLGT